MTTPAGKAIVVRVDFDADEVAKAVANAADALLLAKTGASMVEEELIKYFDRLRGSVAES